MPFPMLSAAGIYFMSMIEQCDNQSQIRQAKQKLFTAVKNIDKNEFDRAVKILDLHRINVMQLEDKSGIDALTAVAKRCGKQIRDQEAKKARCKFKANEILKMFPREINKAQIKLKDECSPDVAYTQRLATCDAMLNILLARKYINLGDYSVLAIDILQNITNDSRQYLELLIEGDDQKIAAKFIQAYKYKSDRLKQKPS